MAVSRLAWISSTLNTFSFSVDSNLENIVEYLSAPSIVEQSKRCLTFQHRLTAAMILNAYFVSPSERAQVQRPASPLEIIISAMWIASGGFLGSP